MKKINPCPKCQSSQVGTNATEHQMSNGEEKQFIWLECEDCGHKGSPVMVSEVMSDEEISQKLTNLVNEWNLI